MISSMKSVFKNGMFLFICCLTGLNTILSGQTIAGPVTQNQARYSMWKGFKRLDFRFEDLDARLIIPDKALPGNPWVWNAYFPDWHTEMDSILVSQGFHVAFVHLPDKFGRPDAVKTWTRFYEFLIGNHHLNRKVALEGVSRGGLYVYNWAKHNPDKVSCIYTEAPVCDFKSWPGGLGKGKGSPVEWNKLKKEFGFGSDEEAVKYQNNPVDNLEPLAAAKVPVLHMIGLNDEIVPPAENTFVLVDKYIKLGGIALVVPCTSGKQELGGHHFPIESPRLAADFIKYYSQVKHPALVSDLYHLYRSDLKNSLIRFEREKKGRVAFLGGSITHNPGWRDSVCNYLKRRFHETEFEFIAAGIPSMGSTPGAFRLRRDVLSHGRVDLLFVEAAVNDATNLFTDSEQIRGMEGIVRHSLIENPSADIVLMYFVDPGKMEDYKKGIVPAVIQNHDLVARHYSLSAINLAKEVTDRIDAGEFSWKKDFRDLHPSPFGQNIYYRSMKTFLENSWKSGLNDSDRIHSVVLPTFIDQASYYGGRLIEAAGIGSRGDWQMVENWKPVDKKGTRADYSNVPMLVGEKPGKTLVFRFRGNCAGIAVAAGPDAGMIDYNVDRHPWIKKDLFTSWSTGLHLPWFYTLASGLKEGKHTLRIRIISEKNSESLGNACRIRYFFVNEPKRSVNR